jgi:PAS domain S-box-containing protein
VSRDPSPLPTTTPSESPERETPDPASRAAERRAVHLRRALDRRIAAVLESVTHAFLALDRDWRVTYANPEAARLNGTTPADLIGRNHWETWPETLGSEVERRYREVVATRTAGHFVHHYPLADVWHEIHVYPADEGGIAVLYRDITEERRAEAERAQLALALAARDRELASVLQNATDVVVRYDMALRFVYANPAIEAALGIAPTALLGKRHDETPVAPDVGARTDAVLRRVFETQEGEEMAFEYETPSGPRHFESRFVPERGASAEVASVLVFTRDVTERVHGARALSAALEAAEVARHVAESANASKSAFLATMSHELRTPLNAIRGYADLLGLGMYGPITDAQRAALERIGASERHLLGLITELLDYAKIESGRARYELTELPIAVALRDAAALVEPQLRGKGLVFEHARPPALTVRADARKLRQIILNLLSNAAKFTPQGGVVALRCCAESERVVVEVADSGVGIPAEQLERIFEPFVQLGRGRGEGIGGAGLGLAISRELARGMGGDLTAASAPSGGAVFRLALPRV